jgi:hypothetical protein
MTLAAMLVLLIVGFIRNPARAARIEFERTLAQSATDSVDINLARDPDFENWQRSISSRASLWGPLVPPQKAVAPAPKLQEMLQGVEPTRNTMGSGPSMRVQIRVDGKKEWFSKGQQAKGCTIEEITPNDVLFTLIQGSEKHGIRLPRK